MMIVERINTYEQFLALEPLWGQLLERISTPSIFLTHTWFKSWWEGFGRDGQLAILLVREGEVPVAIAPFQYRISKWGGLTVRAFEFLANNHSYRGALLVDSAFPRAIDAILDYLLTQAESWDLLFLKDIDAMSSTVRRIRAVAQSKNLMLGSWPSLESPYIVLDEAWESFYRQRSIRLRKNVRHAINRLRGAGSFKIIEYRTPEQVKQSWPMVLEIDQSSWKGAQGSAMGSANNLAFYRALTENFARKDQVRIWLLWLNDRPIAFEYHLMSHGRIYALKASYREDCAHYSPGLVLDAHVIKDAFLRGNVKEYDLLLNNTPAGRLFYGLQFQLRPILRWVKRWLKRCFAYCIRPVHPVIWLVLEFAQLRDG
jgi:CelD/BcsL family acetyltransferase involved in cellulose biosynthesis